MPSDRDEERGYKVSDRRFAEDDASPGAGAAAPPAPEADARPLPEDAAAADADELPPADRGSRPRPGPLPAIDFATFVLSLATSALYHLGEMPRPEGAAAEKNLPMAKQTIDIVAMLRDKTTGNLTDDEAQLVDSLLYDLRMKYVAATAK
jgi:hypothetical protein